MCWRFGLALILAGAPALGDPLTFVRAVPLVSDLPGFGGLSAIEMREPGRAILLSDRGAAFTLTLARAQGQYIVAPSTQPQPHRDSEGLAYSADALFFSYEGPAQIVAQDGTALPTDPGFATYSSNGSFEALAADPDGVLYVLPERSGDITRPFPIHRFRDGVWDIPAHLPRTGPFLTAGADIGPDGLLYILERAFTPLGFRTRIRRVNPTDWVAADETLLITRAGRHDNLEGLAIWQSDSGATCLSMVSDDNFLSVQRSELVEYALTESLADGKTCD